jgi:hypothetical protein
MTPLRDKFGRFVSVKDVGKREIEMAIRLYNEPDPVQEQNALGYCRSVWELIFILVSTIFVIVASVYLVVRI